MVIRFAEKGDIEGIMTLLVQVNDVHAEGRPDLFIKGKTKYSSSELEHIIEEKEKLIFVATNSENEVCGYCFCEIKDFSGLNNIHTHKSLYIDDLCIDKGHRGEHIGSLLFESVKDYALNNGFYNMTLNVWTCNPGAQKFYEAMGMFPMKTVMEYKVQMADE